MAITSDGTHSFGIQDSPITINTVTFVLESFNITYGANRVDIDDSNGEALGATLVPQRVEGTATLQYAAGTTANPSIGDEFTTSSTNGRNNDTWLITEVGDAQTQGDYAKCSISFYNKTN